MVDKRGSWNVSDPLDLTQVEAMLDNNVANRIANDLRKEMGANALKPNKPLLGDPRALLGGKALDINNNKLISGA